MIEEKIEGRFIREWKRDDNKANIVIVHGVAEHSGTQHGRLYCTLS